MTVTRVTVWVETPILGASPIEIQSDVRVNDFADGNEKASEGFEENPFVINFN